MHRPSVQGPFRWPRIGLQYSRMRVLWVTLPVLVAGCLDGLPPEKDPGPGVSSRGACTQLEGMTFTSAQQGECGLTPDGVGLCSWHLRFRAEDGVTTRFTWSHSDVEESGLVSCLNGAIRTEQATAAYDGAFDETSLDLAWDGRAYTLSTAP